MFQPSHQLRNRMLLCSALLACSVAIAADPKDGLFVARKIPAQFDQPSTKAPKTQKITSGDLRRSFQ